LALLEDPDDLLLAELQFLHELSLLAESKLYTLKCSSFQGAGHRVLYSSR
jgi:hypothetical protein